MLTRKAFQYRLYPTPTQEHTLLFVLRRCRHLYNSALEQRRAFYQMRHKSLGYSAQAAELADIKAAYPAYQDIHSQVLQDALRRLDKAFAAFFRRIRNGETPGYPRFQGEGRYDSFTYPQSGFAVADTRGPGQNRYAVLILSKIGDLKVRLHRPLVGQVKTCTIKRDVNHWYVTFSCEVEEEPLPPCAEAVGLDLGVLHFATLSTGETTREPAPLPPRAEAHQTACNRPRTAKSVAPIGANARRLPWPKPIGGCATNERTSSTKPRVPWSTALEPWSLKT